MADQQSAVRALFIINFYRMVEEFPSNPEQIINALVYGLIFLVLSALGIILFFYYSRKTIVKKEIEKIAIRLDYQKQILQNTINIQEEERKRIAQDLHDAISSKLNVVSLTTNVLIDDQTISNEQRKGLHHILEITTKTLENSRKIAHDLMPPTLGQFGLKVALEELFDEFTSNSSLKIESDIESIDTMLPSNQLHLFRITQEFINNALIHGHATNLLIKLINIEHGFSYIFKDNGVGFDTINQTKKAGLGLQNIKSRVAILNANLYIESSEKIGSTFTINSHLNAIQN